jgi:Domain of Unknown Function with PDB structure (DUF3857)
MFMRRWLLTSLLAPLIILCPRTAAAVGFQPVSPEELKMAAEPNAPGAPAILLFRQVDRDDNGRTSHEDDYFRIKILTEEGRKYADVEIPFYKQEGNIVNLRARTIRPDGSIVNFEGKAFDKTIAKAKGLKYMAKTFTLPDVQVGGIIEYYYTLDLSEHYIYDSHWILSNELFTKSAKFSLKSYEGYGGFNLRWSWNWLPPGTSQPKDGPDHVIRMEANNIPAFQTEDFMPPENELKSRVDFIYSDDSFESDPVKFWKRVGKERNGKLESFLGKRQSMEPALAQIVSPNDSPETKLEKIYARVQQIRNTTYEIRKTQQEEKREKQKDATNVADIWKRGYGDGVQLTWLYLALVRAAGIEAYGVWVSDRGNYFFVPQTMDPNRLDGNVVLVKLNGKDIYCDPGAAFAPFGMLPWVETNVSGLRLDKDGGSWVTTSIPPSLESRIVNKARLKLLDNGDLEGKLEETFTGLEALQRRVEERNLDETDRRKFLEDEVKEYIPAAVDVELTNKPDWDSSAPTLVAEFNLKVPGWGSAAGHRALVSVGLFSGSEKRLFDHTNREHSIYFEYPFEKVDDVTMELPTGWRIESVPPPIDQTGHVVGYSLKVEKDKGEVHLSRVVDVDFLVLEAKYYLVLRKFFQGVRAGDEQQIVLQPGAATASN